MSSDLQVRVASRSKGDDSWFEGTVSISGLKTTKLARKSDGATRFSTRSAVSGAARSLAKSLGFAGVAFEETSQKRAAAKRQTRGT